MVAFAAMATGVWAQQPAVPVPPGAVILDHVVAVINGSVILQSDVEEDMRYAVLQPFAIGSARNNTPQRALQRLIDRDLILQQMQTAQAVTPPTPEEVQRRLTELRTIIPECVRYHCETDAGWQAFLEAKGLNEKEVEAHWSQRMMILSFIQSRFGSGVRDCGLLQQDPGSTAPRQGSKAASTRYRIQPDRGNPVATAGKLATARMAAESEE